MLSRRQFLKGHRVGCNHMTHSVNKQVGAVATVEAETHLVQVGLQMLGADAVPCSYDSALQKREGGFDCVGMNVSVNVDLRFVFDGLMLGGHSDTLHGGRVGVQFVGYDYLYIVAHVLSNIVRQSSTLHVLSVEESQSSAALPDANNDLLVGIPVSGLAVGVLLSADVGFVHFDSTVQHGAIYFDHSATYAMAEIPGRLVRAFVLPPEGALELHCAHTLLGFTQQKSGEKPDWQWKVRVMEDRAARNRELVLTTNTLIAGIFFQARHASVIAARAHNAFRPAQALQQLTTAGISGIHFINFRESHASTS